MSDYDAQGERRTSSALARRAPVALNRAPAFFPTGHSESWKVFAVAFGGPGITGAIGSAIGLAAGLGSGALLVGACATPVGMAATSYMLSGRGKKRLKRALDLHLADPQLGLAQLQQIAASNALPEIRVEAAGRIALDALQGGEVAAAIEALSIREQDSHLPRRRRNWETGLRGEILRSILAWLSPGSFADGGIAHSDAFPDDGSDPEGVALLAALRLVECAGHDDDTALASAWSDIAGSGLEHELPTLHVITHALAAERLHHLMPELHDRLGADDTGLYRRLLRQLFPRMPLAVDGGYRAITPDLVAEDAATSLALVAPTALQTLATPGDADLVPVSRGSTAAVFAGTYSLFVVTSILLGGGWLGMMAAVFMALYIGTPIAAIVGSMATQRREQARRIAPLARLDPPPPRSWLTECATGPPGVVTRTSGYRKLVPIPLSQSVVYVAALKAEQALQRGELEAAWEHIQWWFSGFSGKIHARDPLYAVGGSLVRVAAMTGRRSDAHRLLAVLPEVGNAWDTPANRTLYGNAPAAVSLAAALLAAVEGKWDAAATAMAQAQEDRKVYVGPHDQVLLAEIVRRAAGHGVVVQPYGRQLALPMPQWLATAWPEHSTDRGTDHSA